MTGSSKRSKFELIQGGDSDARTLLQAHLTLAEPSATAESITSEMFGALLEDALKERREQEAETFGSLAEFAPDAVRAVSDDVIERILAQLAAQKIPETFDEAKSRSLLEELRDEYLKHLGL